MDGIRFVGLEGLRPRQDSFLKRLFFVLTSPEPAPRDLSGKIRLQLAKSDRLASQIAFNLALTPEEVEEELLRMEKDRLVARKNDHENPMFVVWGLPM